MTEENALLCLRQIDRMIHSVVYHPLRFLPQTSITSIPTIAFLRCGGSFAQIEVLLTDRNDLLQIEAFTLSGFHRPLKLYAHGAGANLSLGLEFWIERLRRKLAKFVNLTI